ncbi:MAG: ABC transporter ATP-binding protein [Burkholderiales bacterium]|nr:ABC transporter ATP-binding protein [Burkholderiales bacterium]
MSSAADSASADTPVLSIRGLQTHFATQSGLVKAVDGVDIEVYAGECLGIVGESGSGKSVTFASVLGLVRPPGRIVAGSVRYRDQDLLALDRKRLRALRGKEIAITLQDALTCLNPALTVGEQIIETLREHRRAPSRTLRAQALEMMALVGIPEPASRLKQYPHEFSGGMRQRVMLAIALACRPRVLIADEPTSALDVTIQAQVLELLARLRRELGMTVVLITHDLGVVAEFCERVVVMYAGQAVEIGPTRALIGAALHPYTRGLIGSIPRLGDIGHRIRPIEGQVPELIDLPAECRFIGRCPYAEPACRTLIAMRSIDARRQVRCRRAGTLA